MLHSSDFNLVRGILGDVPPPEVIQVLPVPDAQGILRAIVRGVEVVEARGMASGNMVPCSLASCPGRGSVRPVAVDRNAGPGLFVGPGSLLKQTERFP